MTRQVGHRMRMRYLVPDTRVNSWLLQEVMHNLDVAFVEAHLQ